MRDELPPSRRTPLMGTLAAHLLLIGDWAAMRQAALETVNQGVAIGLTAAVAWAVESVALYAAALGDLAAAARLAGYARLVHPSVATRAGSRKIVVELAREMSLSVSLRPIERADVAHATEMFLTSSLREIVPVIRVGDQTIGSGSPGPVTRELQSAFRRLTRVT